MAKTFKYQIDEVLNEVNGEHRLIPYWIKLDLLDNGVPIEVDPLHVDDNMFSVSIGDIKIKIDNEWVVHIKWTADKK